MRVQGQESRRGIFNPFGFIGRGRREHAAVRPEPHRQTFGLRRRTRSAFGADRIYFTVRSLGVHGRDHVLQSAFVDDRGNVVMSVLTASPAPAALMLGASPGDLSMTPLPADAFEPMAEAVCHGATLVTFHRVLQGGLLPPAGLAAAAGMDCAWRRFNRVARQRGWAAPGEGLLALSDCLALANLPLPSSEDAVLRALAIRDLWLWLDSVE